MLLTKKLADKIKSFISEGKEVITLSPDLGLSIKSYTKKQLQRIPFEKIKGNFIYLWDEKSFELYKLAIFDGNYYKLEISPQRIPYLVIDGFRMHLQSFSPLQYASLLIRKLSPRGRVLDCFAGLGYVSINLAKKEEVDKVISLEKNPAVIELAKANPYSKLLFSSDKIELHNISAQEFLEKDRNRYDYIISDAPSFRYKEAKSLYSRKFLLSLLDHLGDQGGLYFYTGRIAKNLIQKFLDELDLLYEYDEKLMGFFIKKSQHFSRKRLKNKKMKR